MQIHQGVSIKARGITKTIKAKRRKIRHIQTMTVTLPSLRLTLDIVDLLVCRPHPAFDSTREGIDNDNHVDNEWRLAFSLFVSLSGIL